MLACVDMNRRRGRHDSIFRRIGAAALDAAVLGGIGARWSYRLGLHGTLSVTTHEISVATEKKLAAPLVLAYASDFHAGATTDPALFTGLMSLLRERRPDVHTHGGQIALRDGTPIVCAGGPLSRSHSRGRFEVIGNGPLIVSRGIGCSNLPIRINADPELIVCTLQ
jgi:hypothetical protein